MRHKATLLCILLILTMLVLPLVLPMYVCAASATVYASKDNWIDEQDPAWNYGTDTDMGLGSEMYGGTTYNYRPLLEFTVGWGSNIPSDATITSAQLQVMYGGYYYTSPAGWTVKVQRLLRLDWSETESNWNNYASGESWALAGAASSDSDYSADGEASAIVPASPGGSTWLTWNVLTQVQQAQTNNENPAFRMTLSVPGGSSCIMWLGTHDGSYSPRLIITYTAPLAPTVTTQAATSIAGNTAMLHGTITDTGDATITRRGFQYGLTQTPTWDLHEDGSFGTGAYEQVASGLTPGKAYWFRAYAVNSIGTGYGSWRSFATLNAPTVVTLNATYIGTSSVQLNGQLTNDGGEVCDIRFQYGYTSGVYAVTTDWVSGYTSGNYSSVSLSGLISDTDYFFRVLAKNSAGVVSGSEKSFYTSYELLPPSNFNAHATSGTDISLSWIRGGGVDNTVIQMGTGAYPTSLSDGTRVYYGKSSSTAVSNLTPGTSYYFRAWSESADSFSADYAEDMATTLAGTPKTTPTEPTTPTNWFLTPDYTRLANAPFYDQVNSLWDAYELPHNTGWEGLALLIAALIGVIALTLSNGVIWIALIASGAVIVITSWMGMLPLWPILLIIVMGGGYAYIKARA